MQFLRHVGQMVSTGSRVIIVYMQIPGAEHRTLVIQPDGLPDRYRQMINDLVISPEGQSADNFGDYLGRRKVEGENMDLMTLLHNAGQLVPMPVDNILLTPAGNQGYPMRKVLEEMGRVVPKPGEKVEQVEKRFNPYEHNQQANLEENRLSIARNLLAQASILDDEANRKREEAYRAAPDLRPVTTIRRPAAPEPTPVVVEAAAATETAETDGFQLSLFGDNPAGQ